MENLQLANIERLKLYNNLQKVFNKPTPTQNFEKIAKEREIGANQLTELEIRIAIANSTIMNDKIPLEEKVLILNSNVIDKNIVCTSLLLAVTEKHISYTDFEFMIYNLLK